jgi:hypothetical protein
MERANFMALLKLTSNNDKEEFLIAINAKCCRIM